MRNISELREKAGLTQSALAEKLGVDRSAVAKWESGAASPSFAKVPKLAEALKCEISDLFCAGGRR